LSSFLFDTPENYSLGFERFKEVLNNMEIQTLLKEKVIKM